MELSEEMPTDVKLFRPVGHVIVFVPDQEKYREGALFEPTTPDLFDGSVVGVIDADESGLFPEIVEDLLKRIDAATGTRVERVGCGQLVLFGQLFKIGMAVKEFICVHLVLIL
jgi:hypothetical protein